ncbi:MAG TPA: SDR family oxidoreductase [Polyangiales bacterium]|nr:SDR family oxidoreductase [Polyangiales bacterium]
MKLANKRAIVTGGSSGIGLETARLFLAEGAEVAILARDRARLEQAAVALGVGAVALQADVAKPSELACAIESFGPFDVLFANAGVSETPPLLETTEADFDAFIAINLRGVFFSVVHARPRLRDGASIILTGSVAARKGRPGDPLYAASKGAVRSLGRTLGVMEEIVARRIRVNVLTPGATTTPLTAAATDDPAVRDYIAAMVPMGRWGTAREVAEAALFLASDASSYITGAEITVDGGLAHV